MTEVRVNMRLKVNNNRIRTEHEDGREYLVVPSVTLPDNIIMNGGKYLADEIAASYKGLEGTPAPLGHPKRNGVEIPAMDPLAINAYHIGATNRNVRRVGGKVHVEKWIDVLRANESEGGRRVLEAIKKKKPIHTSTGVFARQELVTNGDGYNWIARNLRFDHDAILLDEPGAAGPDEGVGMLVNSKGEEERVLVINSEVVMPKPSLRELLRSFLTNSVDENTRKEFEVESNSEPVQLPTPEPKNEDFTLDEKTQSALAALMGNALAAATAPLTEAIGKLTASQDQVVLKINEQTIAITAEAEKRRTDEQAEMLEALTQEHGALVANALIKDPAAATEAFSKLKQPASLLAGLRTNSRRTSAEDDDGLDKYIPGATKE